MFNAKTIRGQATTTTVVSLAVLGLLLVVATFDLYRAAAGFDTVARHVREEAEVLIPLQVRIKDIQNDVTQVQQWLTDISATRGQDGLDDGLTKAEAAAARFETDVVEAIRLAVVLEADDMVAKLRDLREAFPPFYDAGKRMAGAYVEFGPTGGNPRMGDVDAAAERLAAVLEDVSTAVATRLADTGTALVDEAESLSAASYTALAVIVALFVIGLAVQGLVSRAMLRLAAVVTKVSGTLATAANGNLDVRNVDIRGDNESAELQRNVNRLLDRTEAFMREVSASMEYTSRGEYFRRIMETGMVGSFLSASQRVNVATDAMQAKDSAEGAIKQELTALIDAAGNGDFSHRLDLGGKEGFYLSLSEGLNNLVSLVQAGVDETVAVMAALATGDLTRRMEGHYQGVFDRLKRDSNETAEHLAEIVGNITSATHMVHQATSEIAAGTSDLASRTEQQASNLEETAAAMEELTATVRQNADNARQANQMSTVARESAEKGGGIVSDAVTAMSRIEDSSGKISEIVNMIDEIAFQTNLLALNAAVEAARAGEAGKGFAVVASEVRALAQRSSAASKEIKGLIDSSSRQVREGVRLVNSAGSTLEEIVTSVKRVADIVSEITSASQEQATGLDEVNTAVSHMDEMTQQNAALVEQTTAAAASLETQADDLANQVAFFKLSGKAAAGAKASAARPAANKPAAAARPTPSRPAPSSKPTAAKAAKPAKLAARGAAPSPAPAPAAAAGGADTDGFDDDPDWQEF